ncbi:hypothetical protein pb186bvf_016153 [Paramecium bursaria]
MTERQGHDHEHGHSHDHHHEEHDHHDDSDEGTQQQGDDDKKVNRGEKKFKKAMIKMGMKQVTGITRVTIRKGKQFLVHIDDPEVFKSAGVDNSFIVFGEAKVNDGIGQQGKQELDKLQPLQKNTQPEKVEVKQEEKEEVNDDDETGISAENIKMVMDHTKCDRKEAVKALKKCNNDSVEAIIKQFISLSVGGSQSLYFESVKFGRYFYFQDGIMSKYIQINNIQPQYVKVKQIDQEEEKEDEDDVTGISYENLEMVIRHVGCERSEAIKALKICENDAVEAIMLFYYI